MSESTLGCSMLLKEEGRGIGCVDRSGGAKGGATEQPTKKSKKKFLPPKQNLTAQHHVCTEYLVQLVIHHVVCCTAFEEVNSRLVPGR